MKLNMIFLIVYLLLFLLLFVIGFYDLINNHATLYLGGISPRTTSIIIMSLSIVGIIKSFWHIFRA
jgi:hypothetical protein